MPRKVALKSDNIVAVMVSVESLELAEKFCSGSIKGTKLPRHERVVEFWSKYRDTEQIAEMGDFIVKLADNIFEVYPKDMFHKLFKDVDTTTF